jgi:DNA modification methylase
MTEKQASDLTESLKRFNLMSIPVVDADDRIVSGHQRMKIMVMLGRGGETIDVRVPNRKLTEEEYTEANLRENKNVGEWDEDLLTGIDTEVLLDIGFDEKELKKLLDLSGPIELEQPGEDSVQAIPAEPKTKFGDLILLGDHRLVCGDSLEEGTIRKLIGSQKVELALTDPPYNVGFEYNTYKDDLSPEEYFSFCKRFKELLTAISNQVFITIGNSNVPMWCKIDDDVRFGYWLKKNTRNNGYISYFSVIEPFVFFGTLKMKRDNDLFEHLIGNDEIAHTCPKPVQLFEDIIGSYTNRGDHVLDIFGGSGTTLIACEKVGRKCLMSELDPGYCDAIVARWEELTCKKALYAR